MFGRLNACRSNGRKSSISATKLSGRPYRFPKAANASTIASIFPPSLSGKFFSHRDRLSFILVLLVRIIRTDRDYLALGVIFNPRSTNPDPPRPARPIRPFHRSFIGWRKRIARPMPPLTTATSPLRSNRFANGIVLPPSKNPLGLRRESAINRECHARNEARTR